MIKDDLYDRGLAVRREMFGSDGAERQTESTTELNDKLQDIVTRHCFGDIWERDGLGRRDRSLITLGMLVALGRAPEIEIHLRGALANGVTAEEIRELVIHSSLYCGIPAAMQGVTIAQRVLDEQGQAC